jgi:hypothetical protein
MTTLSARVGRDAGVVARVAVGGAFDGENVRPRPQLGGGHPHGVGHLLAVELPANGEGRISVRHVADNLHVLPRQNHRVKVEGTDPRGFWGVGSELYA